MDLSKEAVVAVEVIIIIIIIVATIIVMRWKGKVEAIQIRP